MTSQPTTGTRPQPGAAPWSDAMATAYAAGSAARLPAGPVPLADAEGLTLAEPLVTLTDLPPFTTASVDGWATRGDGPWRPVGRVLAGQRAGALTEDGTCVEIATGAMVPAGATTIVRLEAAAVRDGLVSGAGRVPREWREPGEEASKGEELLAAGTRIDPGVIGLAASCGYDLLPVRRAPAVAVLVFGDELRTAGLPADGGIRDSLGPSLPGWLRRLGARPVPGHAPVGPVTDTLDAHVHAITAAFDAGADVVVTTGGTMRGPVDHLHPALAVLGADYLVNTVAVRPGHPMLLAHRRPAGGFVAGLPGNPQSAVIALVSLVAPLLAGLTGARLPRLQEIRLAADLRGRPGETRLVLVDQAGRPLPHAGSAMLRGLASAAGFAVVPPDTVLPAGGETQLVPLPLLPMERA